MELSARCGSAPNLVGVRILVLADVIDKAGGVTLVLCRPAGGLVAERTVVHQGDRLKCMALWAKAVEKVGKVTRGQPRPSELIRVGVVGVGLWL